MMRQRTYPFLHTFTAILVVCIVTSILFLLAACSSQNPIVNPPPAGRWKIVSSQNPGKAQNNLNAIAATSATDAWAVGSFSNQHLGVLGTKALIEHWNGAEWSVVASPPAPLGDGILTGVAAISPTDAWAVGYTFYDNASYVTKTLIEHWNGSVWTVVASPGIGTNTTTLNGVLFLPHSSRIMAVGTGTNDGIPIQETVPPPGSGTYDVTPVTAQALVEVCCF